MPGIQYLDVCSVEILPISGNQDKLSLQRLRCQQ